MPSFADQRRTLSALLHGALPSPRASHIESLIRDTIAITPRKPKKPDSVLGASRLGGCPDLPIGSAWPTKEDGRVDFVAQLRLEDLAPLDAHHRLPPTGLVSFFHGYRTSGEYEAEARVLYFPDAPHGLAPIAPPHRRGLPKPVGIDFAPMAMLPPHSSPLVPLELVGASDPYAALFDAHYRIHDDDDNVRFHGLFGFDRPLEAEQRADEEVLLRLDATGGVPYDFVEAACAYYFIARDDLARRDFSKVRLYEGASI